MINQKKMTTLTKKLELKRQCLDQIYAILVMRTLLQKATITVTNPNNAKRNKAVALKNNAPFINCITKVNGIKIDNAEDLDVVILMYNLLEYSKK